MNIFHGVPVTESRSLCRPFTEQRRKHRRARINKKWRKRYGMTDRECRGQGYQMGKGGSMHFVGCPHFVAQIRKAYGVVS